MANTCFSIAQRIGYCLYSVLITFQLKHKPRHLLSKQSSADGIIKLHWTPWEPAVTLYEHQGLSMSVGFVSGGVFIVVEGAPAVCSIKKL